MKYGAPKPGQKVFIVTRQQKNGWKETDKETNEVVPGIPAVLVMALSNSVYSPRRGARYEPSTRHARDSTKLNRISIKLSAVSYLAMHWLLQGLADAAAGLPDVRPCSAGRMKRWNVAYLGLLAPPENGVSDITDIYIAKLGAPKPGPKVFIVNRQQKNRWKGTDKETNEIVRGIPAVQQAPAEAALSLKPLVHTGCAAECPASSSMLPREG